MKKRDRKRHSAKSEREQSVHFENLIELRERNPQAYARLGEAPNFAVEKYEAEQLASSFEHRAGFESLLELKGRLPGVYVGLCDKTKQMVEEYAERKRAYEIINGGITSEDYVKKLT